MSENRRKCLKCGHSPAVDPDTKLFRYPKPGRTNILRCELWAKYCFPDAEWSSQEFQRKLHREHKMLCHRHFKRTSFIDYPQSTNKLHRFAVPDEEMPMQDKTIDVFNGVGNPTKVVLPAEGKEIKLCLLYNINEPSDSSIVEGKGRLNYCTKELIKYIECCSMEVNKILQDKGHAGYIKSNVLATLIIKNDEFLRICSLHFRKNKNYLLNSVFHILCVKRFCVLKNRILHEEASKIGLKKKNY